MNITKKFKKTQIITIIVILLAISATSILYYTNKETKLDNVIKSLESPNDLDPLIEKMALRDYVLLGESTHGSSQYYYWRSEISKKLIESGNFRTIIVEGDWDALYEVNLYVKHINNPEGGGKEILSNFSRWPTWMWANYEFLELVEWTRDYNKNLDYSEMVGIYGKDVYGAENSMGLVVKYLEEIQSNRTAEVADLYNCLLDYRGDYSLYINDVFNSNISCVSNMQASYNILEEESQKYNLTDTKEFFNAKQNALVAIYAEKHYRNNIHPDSSAWNSRVMGMESLINNLANRDSKVIIWAHNTHIGDARATSMKETNTVNIGQLLKEAYGDEKVFNLGFGTYSGSVTAALSWNDTTRNMLMPLAKLGSLEAELSNAKYDNYYITFDNDRLPEIFTKEIGHRAKGVVYNPANDHLQYVPSIISERYNAFIFIKNTSALNHF